MNKHAFAFMLALIVASVAVLLAAHIRDKRAVRSRAKHAELAVTDATTWEVQMNGVAVATIREHVVAEIERRTNRAWWLGVLTAVSEFGTFVRLAAVSGAAALAIEALFIALSIQDDPRGAGHVLHSVFSASEVSLQSAWAFVWEFGALIAAVTFWIGLMAGTRRRARDFVAEAWWTGVRREARVAFDGSLALILTQGNRRLWRSPRRVDWVRLDRPSH